MKITYDKQVDAAYIYFIETARKVTNHQLSEDIWLDYDSDGHLVGMEILSAKKYLDISQKDPTVSLQNIFGIQLPSA